MTAIADRYRRRADAFEQKVAAVSRDHWANQSPCRAWNARDVVDHVVDMHAVMLVGVSPPLTPNSPTVQDDPLGAFRAARARVESALDDPDVAAVQCRTPTGHMTVEQQIDQVVSDDLVLHGWDLARATGQDETMDPDDVERLWQSAQAVPDDVMVKYRTPGAFGPGVEVYGPEVPVPATAPLQDRLLGLIGRDPRR